MEEKLQIHAFEPLLQELSASGFYFGVDTWLRLYRWLSLQVDKPEDVRQPEQLRFALSALLCHTEDQQRLFAAAFDRYFQTGAGSANPVLPGLSPAAKAAPPPETAIPAAATAAGKETAPIATTRIGPIRVNLRFPNNALRVWNHAEMDKAMQPLREKEWADSYDWDIPGSIRQTIRAGGIPQFVYQRRKRAPSYLVLIEQRSLRDHLAAFYREMVLEMNRRDIDADYYFYDTIPHQVWKERNSPHHRIPIERLAGEQPEARLLLIGAAEAYLALPRLSPSNLAFQLREHWPQLALMCSNPVPDWGRRELALCQLFPVVPASAEGLASLLRQWNASYAFTPAYWTQEHPEPSLPQLAFRGREVPEEVILQLRRYLGSGAFRWLCATAWYPELYFEMSSLFHDEAIPPRTDYSEWEQNLVWWVAMYRLFRLPWFRNGHLPGHIRESLRNLLPEEDAFQVREQILRILQLPENAPPPGSYADTTQTFTMAWLASEQQGGSIGDFLPMHISLNAGDIEDAIGRKIWIRQEEEKVRQSARKQGTSSYQSSFEASSFESRENIQDASSRERLSLKGYVSLLQKTRKFSGAIELLSQMRAAEIRPDITFFNLMAEKTGNLEECRSLLAMMRESSIIPTDATLAAMVKNMGSFDEAAKMVGEMQRNGLQAGTSTAAALLYLSRNFREAVRTMRLLPGITRTKPDSEVYLAYMQQTENLIQARQVLDELGKLGLRPDKKIYTVYLSKAPDYETARNIFAEAQKEGIEPDPPMFTTLFSKLSLFSQLAPLYKEMLRHSISPNRGMFTLMMQLAQAPEEVEWVEAQMRAAGIGEGTIRRTREQRARAGQPGKKAAPKQKKAPNKKK
jgi:hypothetical protein